MEDRCGWIKIRNRAGLFFFSIGSEGKIKFFNFVCGSFFIFGFFLSQRVKFFLQF